MGEALKTADARFASPETGTVLHDVTLQLGAFGTLRLDLEIVAARPFTTSKGEPRFVMRLPGCVQTPGLAERILSNPSSRNSKRNGKHSHRVHEQSRRKRFAIEKSLFTFQSAFIEARISQARAFDPAPHHAR